MANALRRHRVLLSVIGAIVGILVIGVLLAMSWLHTYRQAQSAQSSVTALRSAFEARQWKQVPPLLEAAHTDAAGLNASTHAVPWRLLGMIPFVGASAGAAADLAESTDQILAAAEPLLPYGEKIVNWRLQGNNGSLDLTSLHGAAPGLKNLGQVLADAAARLSTADVGRMPPALANSVKEVRDIATSAAGPVAVAADLVTWGPSLLGADGQRSWLVMLQNPAEARGAGGFPGGFVTVAAHDGRIAVTQTGTSDDLSRKAIPDGSAPRDSQALWGKRLKAWNTFNESPHFPLTAELAAAGMAARGNPVSGVISIDPRTVAAILTAIGPVSADGETISADNAERFFTVDVYSKYRNPRQRDQISMALVRAVLAKLLTTQLDPVALVNALRDPVVGGHVHVWSARPKEEAWLVNTPVGGNLPDPRGPIVAVATNNSAGSKMDAFMSTKIDYQPGLCDASVGKSSLTVTLKNQAPKGLPSGAGTYDRYDDTSAPAGSTSTVLYVYPPVGANFISATLDGQKVGLYLGHERGRQVWYVYLPINRDQQRTLDVRFGEPSVPDVQPKVLTQTMVIDPDVHIAPTSSCY